MMDDSRTEQNAERRRLAGEKLCPDDNGLWRKWGPYLSERQWGTVREDYGAAGNAWDYFPHEQARSRTYRWGEDGIAGYSDNHQRLCLSLALWNGRDRILKERLFGLTNSEGNHGEDCKELYYYLDATPTHSWLRMLYKYPQREFPYDDLLAKNRTRGKTEPEYELPDTGVFADDRYFDVFVEYAKDGPEAVNMLITVCNRGPEDSAVYLLPQLWFRNSWSWRTKARRPEVRLTDDGRVRAVHPRVGEYEFFVEGADDWLFTENETNPRLFGRPGEGFYKDAFHEALVAGNVSAVNPAKTGTKVMAVCRRVVPAGGAIRLRVCLRPPAGEDPFAAFDAVVDLRKAEADEFYGALQSGLSDDALLVQRQAYA